MELKQGGDRSKWIANSNHNIQCFTEGEIERMTSNYKTILGRGAFGEVYRGVLENSSVVAVKKFVHNVKENFDQELTVHREINHKNVVRLIGYCVEENALMMVTEYIANGNLNGILHSNDRIPISLETRLRIATECAEALAYMHSYMYTQVIHGDIKPANILLDGSLKAKISDFGISRLVNDPDRTLFTSHVMGSIGYMDPLFARDGRLTAKSDVYSFGVVMVELITRRRAATSSGEANIVVAFTNALANGVRGVREFFDAEIASQRNMKILEGIAKLAGQCMRMERDRRPEIIDVVERLRTLGRASHQGQQRADLFSWARKSKPPPPALVTTPLPARVRTRPPPLVMTSRSDPLCWLFSLEEMMAATRNFDESLRILVNPDDYNNRVYCGGIDGGATKVAITRPRYYSHGNGREFRSVIETRSKLKHCHIVPLIGYCDESSRMILVYDFMARGSLHHHLYMTQKPLTWKQRLEICIGAARGLHYLHRGTEQAIIHGSLDSTKILLDENWVAKIIDGGLPGNARDGRTLRFSFLEPKNKHTYRLTEESDVHDFGALLFEVLLAKVDRILPKKYMLKRALRYKKERRLDELFEPALEEEINLQSLDMFAETAARCVGVC
ncbi:unnamed protein product [Urochloa decumbens]|uniref:Protein kinase domain-containing protein n=1 Tax=Urochloa decumbens TaxID=240449 RepID=A0ABC9AQE3_9POAL